MANSDGTSSGADSHPVVFMKGGASDDVWDDTALIEAYDRAVGLTYDAVNAAIRDSGDDELQGTVRKTHLHTDDPSRHKKKTRRAGRRIKKWKVGDLCVAPYSEDGEYYDALVTWVDSANDRCSVEFLGYGEAEEMALSSIHKYAKGRTLVLTRTQTQTRARAQLSGKKRRHHADCSTPSSTVVASTSAVYSDSLTAIVRKKFRRDDDGGDESADDDVDEEQPDAPTSSVSHAVAASHGHFPQPASSGVPQRSPIPLLAPPPPPAFADLPASTDQEALSSMLMSWYMSGYHTGYYQALQDVRKKKGRKGGGD